RSVAMEPVPESTAFYHPLGMSVKKIAVCFATSVVAKRCNYGTIYDARSCGGLSNQRRSRASRRIQDNSLTCLEPVSTRGSEDPTKSSGACPQMELRQEREWGVVGPGARGLLGTDYLRQSKSCFPRDDQELCKRSSST